MTHLLQLIHYNRVLYYTDNLTHFRELSWGFMNLLAGLAFFMHFQDWFLHK